MLLNILGKFKFITKVFTLIDNLVSKEIGQLDDVVNVVTVFNVVWFVDHSDVVKDVVFSGYELKQYDTNWPDIWLVWLMSMMKNWLQRHISFCTDLVSTNNFQAVTQSSVDSNSLLKFSDTLLIFFFHFFQFLSENCFKFRINFSKPKVNNHTFFSFRIIEEVSRFNVSMIDSKLFEIFEPYKKFQNIMFYIFNGEGVKESLSNKIKELQWRVWT